MVVHELRAEGRQIAKQALVDQRGKTVEFEQRVLQRRGREQQLSPILQCPAQALPNAIALAVGVAQLVRLVDRRQVAPGDSAPLSGMGGGKVQRADGNWPCHKRVGVAGGS